ncbi:hypothetical protein CFPU101_32910 [Chroococcus sp. FPU101]|nr:hypothetical protein CFPU101_32910 [Chroococcus sp. FPU101]
MLLHPKTIKTQVILAALLWLIVINPGSITIVDTAIRLQMAHAWWTGEEEVLPGSQLAVEVRGEKFVPYDLGQSILMLPVDYVGTQLGQWLPTEKLRQNFREAIISFFVFLPLNLVLVVCVFQFLKLFDFEEKQAGAASLVWLLGTTVLYYAAVHQQNNQVLLFVLIGYQMALVSVLRQQRKWAVLSGISLGMAYLVRLTSIIHGCSVLLFLLGCVAYQSRSMLQVFKFLRCWLAGFISIFLLERGLTYIRYGSFLATSVSLHIQVFSYQEVPATTISVVQGEPNQFRFWEMLSPVNLTAISGPLFSAEKSIFIYDPLLLPALVIAFLFWKRLNF